MTVTLQTLKCQGNYTKEVCLLWKTGKRWCGVEAKQQRKRTKTETNVFVLCLSLAFVNQI